jgi:hypothetical protein
MLSCSLKDNMKNESLEFSNIYETSDIVWSRGKHVRNKKNLSIEHIWSTKYCRCSYNITLISFVFRLESMRRCVLCVHTVRSHLIWRQQFTWAISLHRPSLATVVLSERSGRSSSQLFSSNGSLHGDLWPPTSAGDGQQPAQPPPSPTYSVGSLLSWFQAMHSNAGELNLAYNPVELSWWRLFSIQLTCSTTEGHNHNTYYVVTVRYFFSKWGMYWFSCTYILCCHCKICIGITELIDGTS